MVVCSGVEQHEHYVLGTDQTVAHTHEHSVNKKDFNRIHHHAPLEHDNFTTEQLTADAVYITKTPF